MGKRKASEGSAQDGTEGKDGPFVMYFPSGYAPDEQEAEECKFVAYRKKAANQHKHITLVAETAVVDFVGQNFPGECAGQQPCQYAVGVYDKEKDTLKLVPVAGERIFRMQPRVRGFDYEPPAYTPAVQDELGNELRRDRYAKLANAFGRENLAKKREERNLTKILSQHVGGQESLKAAMAAGVEGHMSQSTLFNMVSGLRNIPPHNMGATRPQEAYPFEQLVPRAEQACVPMAEIMQAVQDNANPSESWDEWRTRKRYHPLVMKYMPSAFKCLEEKQKGEYRKRCILLYYLHALLRVKQANSNAKYLKKSQLRGLPEALQELLLEKFAETKLDDETEADDGLAPDTEDTSDEEDGGAEKKKGAAAGKDAAEAKSEKEPKKKAAQAADPPLELPKETLHQMSGKHKDLLLCYILVVALAINDYNVDYSDLAKEFQMQPKQILVYFRELGCVTGSGSGQRGRAMLLPKTETGKAKTLEECMPSRELKKKAKKG